MKFICYTTKEREPIWRSLTSDLLRDQTLQLSFLDLVTGKPISPSDLQRSPIATPTSPIKFGAGTKFTQIIFVDGPSASTEQLQKLQKETSMLRSSDQSIVHILLLDASFEEIMQSAGVGTSQLQTVLRQARQTDGIMLTLESTAEVLRCHWLGPICGFFSCQFESDADKASQIAQSHSLGESMAFTNAAESILQSALIWKPISTTCATVATELKFLGIDGQSQAIDKVGANLKLLMPAFEL